MNLSTKTVSRIIDLLTIALTSRGITPSHPGSKLCFQELINHHVYDESVVKMFLFTVIYKENGSIEPEKCSMLTHQIFIDYQVLLLDEFQKIQSVEQFNKTDFNPFELIHNPVSFDDDETEDKVKAS